MKGTKRILTPDDFNIEGVKFTGPEEQQELLQEIVDEAPDASIFFDGEGAETQMAEEPQ